ncbi:MAG: universal stress protein [Marivita sp.]|jgi:nucleotide-binding universal stress UspA family protein|uniref:universal stress protein n=1 Tax=Marivita sp. TaxID=2003365 RepID=UPI003EF41AAE
MADTIVVATDGSDTGRRAVDFAATMSKEFGQPLCIVHVLMLGRPTEEFAKMAEVEGLAKPALKSGGTGGMAALSGLFPSAEDEIGTARMITALGEHVAASAKERAEEVGARNVTTRICAGDIADEILDIAEAEKADVIVLGRRGLGRVREVLLGSVSQKVLHHADCKVVIVP